MYQSAKELANKAKIRVANVIDGATGKVVGIVGGTAALVASSGARAAAVDLTALTTAVDFSSTTTAILGVCASLIVVYIAWKAASMVIAASVGPISQRLNHGA